MRVLCKYNKLNMVDNRASVRRLKKSINLSDDDELGVDIGKEYIVYGIVFWDNAPWYYICEDEDDNYPTPSPADLFDIVDNHLPAGWQLSFRCINGKPESEIVFSEWANDPMFYEKLVDGSKREIDIFLEYKKLAM